MRATVNDTVSVRLVTADGVHRAVCDDLCGMLWRAQHGVPVTVDIGDLKVGASCAYCARCGEVVAAPSVCRVHDDPEGCPEFDALMSSIVAGAAKHLTHFTGSALSPRGWQYLESCASTCRANDLLTIETLVRRMMDLRVNWDLA